MFLKSHCGQILNVSNRGDFRTIVGCKSQDSGPYWIRFVVVFQPIQKSGDVFSGKAHYFRRLSPDGLVPHTIRFPYLVFAFLEQSQRARYLR